MIVVGQDVHVRNSMMHAKDAEGQVLLRGRCGNTLMELGQRLAPVERQARDQGEPVRIVMESTTNSRGVRCLLLKYGREAGIDLTVDVLHARKLRVIAESVNKCDRIDAEVLADLARSNLRLPLCYMPDDDEFALREHLRARTDLVRMRTMLKNRVHAVLHRRGILAPQTDLFVGQGRAFLQQVELDAAGRTILDRFLEQIDQIHAVIEASSQSLRDLARTPRWSRAVGLLTTIPGVGLITALTVLAELGDIRRFRSRAAVANYSGLVPACRSSNDHYWTSRITRRGSCHLRGMLAEAAWIAVRKVPVYQSLFERVERRRGAKRAVVAVARRILEDCFTLLRKDEPFRYVPAFVSDECEGGTPQGRRTGKNPCGVPSSIAG